MHVLRAFLAPECAWGPDLAYMNLRFFGGGASWQLTRYIPGLKPSTLVLLRSA